MSQRLLWRGPGGPIWCPEGRGLGEEGRIPVSPGVCFRKTTGQSAFPSKLTCMQSLAWSQHLRFFSPCQKEECHPALEGTPTFSSLQFKDICILPAPLPTMGSKTEEPQQEGKHTGCPPGAGQDLPAGLAGWAFLSSAWCLSCGFHSCSCLMPAAFH